MSRRVNTAALAKVLDALHIQQKATLLALPYDVTSRDHASSFYTPQLAAQTSTEGECNELVRSAILDSIEIKDDHCPPTPGSTSVQPSSSKAPAAARSTPLAPREEVGNALEGRRLHCLDLSASRVTASFNRSDLTRCLFIDSYFAKSSFNLSTLSHGNLSGARFQSCLFHGTEACDVTAAGARFSHCIFERADLRRWDVRGATFYRCRFSLCDLGEWLFDGQTAVMEPEDWSRCRRLAWRPASGSTVGECRVVGVNRQAASLPPREP